jgi:biopolymer transport protein ExbB
MRHRYSSRYLGTGACALVTLVFGLLAAAPWALRFAAAQEEGAAVDEAPADDAPAEDAPADDAPADDAAAAPAAGAGAAPEAEAAPPAKSKLRWFYDSLGLLYTVAFLFLSFCLVALVVMNLLGARRDNVVPLSLVEGFEAHLNEKRFQEAYELAKSDDSFLGHVLAAGLAKLSSGYAQAIEAMQEMGEEENMKLEHRLSYVALIGSISPMVGLLGTVDGMVDSFIVIAQTTTAPKPSELAAGISKALVTTLVGLWLAIPAIAIYGILRNRMARLVLEVGILSEGLMSRFQNVGPKKA